MKSIFTKVVLTIGLASLVMSGSAMAYTKADYEKKVKTNEFYVGVVAAVINGLCPKLVVDASVCNPKDPVGTAVGIQNVMLHGEEDIDDVDEDLIEQSVHNIDAAFQFYDAVEQFKGFLGQKADNAKYAAAGDWKNATIGEEQAWQYIVKTASRSAFAADMLGDTKTSKMIRDLAADY
ncbi:MAG: hypothetical protein COB67_11055 [SAR324 cluster bacterium]|uniref:Uncharacterized protein n=1 Tax=SAR324 cluster bacterium TaxID=2024889 RepID=A0A2A4SWQ6_9DELT|nr:MAG: hypothetical protein COB67_11055 [SAR324 cluster bacterium]